MKVLFVVALVVLANSIPQNIEKCFESAKVFKDSFVKSIQNQDVDVIIDDLEKLFESYPDLLETCGAEEKAKEIRTDYPPACTKVLDKEAKLLVKIMRLYSEDPEKNQKAILMYTTLFETIYKTQVQKKCPTMKEVHIKEVKDKGKCAEGMYRLSLTFEKFDNDLMAGKFNESLTDMGKVVQKIPDTLDSCSQHHIAQWIRGNFPVECLSAIGAFVREVATLEHNYTHIEWLKKHFKDFTSSLIRVKDTCPALEI